MSEPARLRVELGARSYDIVVGRGLLERSGQIIRPVMRGNRAVVVTDKNVAALHLAPFAAGLAAVGISHNAVVLAPGEATKDFAHYAQLAQDILGLGIERATPIIALGGGVVGDLAGFAAATVLRGVDFIQVPTTLLAQVDSSVGGKTAIDTPQGKNLVGAFHQPLLVLADTDALTTLPLRELRAGYAEVVKYGLIRDRRFFNWLERYGAALIAGDVAVRQEAILRSCMAKAAIVGTDERESGDRALLNFGHTFGHALETEFGYGAAILHGEAVAIGMQLAFDLSVRLGFCPKDAASRVGTHFSALGLPTDITAAAVGGVSADALLAHMQKDKKVRDGRITLILARDIGDAFICRDVAASVLREFLGEVTARSKNALQA